VALLVAELAVEESVEESVKESLELAAALTEFAGAEFAGAEFAVKVSFSGEFGGDESGCRIATEPAWS
jgi:hypothetical protein